MLEKLLDFIVLVISIAILFFGLALAAKADEEKGLPICFEQVDEIIVINTDTNDYGRVVFIRNQKILATRLLLEEMIFSVNQDNQFQLTWRDYWTAERIVTAPKYSTCKLPYDPTQLEQRGMWWNQNRNMCDLIQPR